jgi:hypothetical protein
VPENAEQFQYPQSFLAMGNGDLVQVTNFRCTYNNKAKQVHTLRRAGAGIVKGKPECTVTFDSSIDEDGPERDYWALVKDGTIKQLRVKCPGGVTLTINGAFSAADLDGPLEDATKVSCTFVGRLSKS